MRAVFFEGEFNVGDTLSLSLDQIHHLKNVLKLHLGTGVFVLNGKGAIGMAKLIRLDKKNANVIVESIKNHRRQYHIDLFLGCPKKEYLAEIFRIATQLGIENIYIFEGQHSSYMYRSSSHFDRIVKSALLQSNGPFFPEICVVQDIFTSLNEYSYPLFFMTAHKSVKAAAPSQMASLNRIGFVVGPEGGFSIDEEKFFFNLKGCSALSLSTPILKTVTAVPVGFGYLYSLLKVNLDESHELCQNGRGALPC